VAGVEIVTIGDELLLGLTIDTNGAWLARELGTMGVTVTRRASVPDDATAIVDALRDALRRTGAAITTGGLGPTADDLTKPAVAELFGRGLYFDEGQWERIREIWRSRRGTEPPDINRQQVMLPEGCVVLTNRHGTAPGVLLEDAERRWVAMLPGVPREMRGLWNEELKPLVAARLPAGSAPIRTVTVRTTGIAESALPERLRDAARGVGRLSLAYLPGQEGVDLRLTARDIPANDVDAELASGARLLRERVGSPVYAEEQTDLADVVLSLCRATRHTLSVAESCTGGLLGARITAIPGSSDVFLGGVIAYANEVKVGLLGVPEPLLREHGAVSEPVALAMAKGARLRTGATIGIGLTGIAGPGGATPGKPVGTVCFGFDVDGRHHHFSAQLIGDRAEVRFRATQAALDYVRRSLAGSVEA
jgi:nicotinamide-nucleotide amidase